MFFTEIGPESFQARVPCLCWFGNFSHFHYRYLWCGAFLRTAILSSLFFWRGRCGRKSSCSSAFCLEALLGQCFHLVILQAIDAKATPRTHWRGNSCDKLLILGLQAAPVYAWRFLWLPRPLLRMTEFV